MTTQRAMLQAFLLRERSYPCGCRSCQARMRRRLARVMTANRRSECGGGGSRWVYSVVPGACARACRGDVQRRRLAHIDVFRLGERPRPRVQMIDSASSPRTLLLCCYRALYCGLRNAASGVSAYNSRMCLRVCWRWSLCVRTFTAAGCARRVAFAHAYVL